MRQPRPSGTAPTIFDVARESGFSTMTVSRVINHEKGVRQSTREAVQTAIDRLNYAPNQAARSLAGVEPVRIGLLYSNPSAAYLSQLLIGALAEARKRHAMLVVEQCEPDDDAEVALAEMLDEGVDGVILSAPLNTSQRVRELLRERGAIGVAVADTEPHPQLSCVKIDDFAVARAMTEHLIAAGHRHIGFIAGDPRQSDSHARLAGFRAAMTGAGLDHAPDLVAQGHYTYHSGLVAAERLLAVHPRVTAIFASNDDMAAGTVAVAHRLGLDVPRDISVCGFDDTEFSQLLWPPLTTIHQPIAAMSRAALGLLVDTVLARRMGKPAPLAEVLLAFRLISRQSVAPPG